MPTWNPGAAWPSTCSTRSWTGARRGRRLSSVPSPAERWLPNGHAVRVAVTARDVDPLAQVMRETWRFTETDPAGTVVRVQDEELRLRWTYRHELRYLLELHGFAVTAEYADFAGSPPAYGRELVVVARREEVA
jgi:hypothetical protein